MFLTLKNWSGDVCKAWNCYHIQANIFFVGRERKISSRQKLKDIKFKFQETLNSVAIRADSTELVKRYRQFKTPKQR